MESIKRVDENGNIYYENEKGAYHRIDGPAYIGVSGHKAWIINGLRHREDGPAVVFSSGTELYYLNGKQYSKEDYESKILKLKLKRIKDL